MRAGLLLLLTACNFVPHFAGGSGSDGSPGDDAPVIDARSDGALIDAPKPDAIQGLDAGDFCIGPPGWAICQPTQPGNSVNLAGDFDTDGDGHCAQPTPSSWTDDQDDACVVVANQIGVTGTLTVHGSRPLVLAAATQLTLSSGISIDVASHQGGQRGAGSPFAQCSAPKTTPTADMTNGGGGGAGATFMTKGGDGGFGNNDKDTNGGASGNADPAPTKLRAGCDGQPGADGSMPAAPAARGGGAIYLASAMFLQFDNNTIDASGEGGGVGGHNSGGDGGASGGMVVLWSQTLPVVTGLKITANGGGGASGADNNGANRAGGDPVVTSPATPAAGGGGGAGAGGGAGFAIGANAKNGGNGASGKAGGGGGGGSGYIRANSPLVGNAGTSPAIDVVTP